MHSRPWRQALFFFNTSINVFLYHVTSLFQALQSRNHIVSLCADNKQFSDLQPTNENKHTTMITSYGNTDVISIDSEDDSRGNHSPHRDENPFRIPTDEEVFMMRDKEKRRKREERQRLSQVPVHEKSTWSTRLNVRRHNDRELDKRLKETNAMIHANMERRAGSKQSKNTTFPPIQREKREKENMSQFIEKKRQMFLIQMSLDTKKNEIQKLEKKAEERERRLQLEEEALKRDAQRFDNFLTNNDIQAVQRAEEETKLKQAKQNEIKKLNSKKTAIKNDISKLKDQLSKCLMYKEFLESLTPGSGEST